ncbi:MAG: hypothetical protein ABIN97_09820 [Ginsengibacter sp.]
MPYQVRDIIYNITTKRYELTRNEITYSMTLEHTRHLKENIEQAGSFHQCY